MDLIRFKLKQASAVLGVPAKDLQNLVQLKVVRPPRRGNLYWFDRRLLLEAKMAFYLKDALGSSSDLLSLFTEKISQSIGTGDPGRRAYVLLRSRPAGGDRPIEIRIPVGSLARELEAQIPRAAAAVDLTRGRRRTGWKTQMDRAFEAAAGQIGEISESDIETAVREYRKLRKALPEVTVLGNAARKIA